MKTSSNIPSLLDRVKRILSHHSEIEKLKGEKFNIFSILRMETRENDTHSAFLAELLDPDGTHLKGGSFLKLFLQSTNLEGHLDIASTSLRLEYPLGPIDHISKTGGRVDIFLRDKNQKTICIENKIYAGDGLAQVERYCNFNKDKNQVIYLNLDGKEPSLESKGELSSGTDFTILSYRDDIMSWLESCVKEAANEPILRETIKQYIILLKKMTTTTDPQHEMEIIDLLKKHFEEAAFVASYFVKAKEAIQEEIRTSVMAKLEVALATEFDIYKGVQIDKRYAQLWIKFKVHPRSNIYFGIESFNGNGNSGGDLYVGIFNQDAKINSYTIEKNSKGAQYWYDETFIEFEGQRINLGSDSFIIQMQQNASYREDLIRRIVEQTIAFVDLHKNKLLPHI